MGGFGRKENALRRNYEQGVSRGWVCSGPVRAFLVLRITRVQICP